MPSSMTHTYFGSDVYKGLNHDCQNIIKDNLEYFKLFCQGSDPFMFYNFMVGRKSQKIRDIQSMMHKSKTQDFFITTIRYIYDNNLRINSNAMAYLYGYICHYYLDMYIHPFVYYKGGIYKKRDKNTYKYNGVHQKIEYAIDLYLIEKRENINPKYFKVYKNIFDISSLNDDLFNIIDNSIGVVYNIENVAYYYDKSIKNMRSFFKYINQDRYGVKLMFYRLFDYIMHDHFIKIEELSFSNVYRDIDDYLNINHNTWCMPYDKDIKLNSSFFDLYNEALDKSICTIEEVSRMLCSKELDINKLKEIFDNSNYTLGIDCNKKVLLKYFAF